MTPRPTVTARDLTAKHMSPAAKAVFQRALEGAYRDQQALLKKAKKLEK